MKKSVLALAVLSLSLASCKKEYKCECTRTEVYGAYNTETIVSTREISKTTKKTAEAICGNSTDVYSDSFSSGSGTSSQATAVTNCVLK